jgi:nanoRNase/pAp phosphatase (c-di-AMP/oligoRNAs hydrolase)
MAIAMDAPPPELFDSERIVVIVHRHADLDSVGAAVGLATTLEGHVDIATPSSVAGSADRLLDGQSVVTDPDLAGYDLQIVVDAPSRQRIAPIDPTTTETPLLVIDHHEPGDLQANATYHHVDTTAPATAALVANLLRANDLDIPPAGAQALAAGILDDTDFYGIVMPDIQPLVCELLRTATATDTALTAFWEQESPWSEQVATAKAIVRATGYKAGRQLLLITRVGGHERAAADVLVDGGADIGIVLSERDDHTRVVASSTVHTEISLPEDVLEPLATILGGDGGGHATSGVAKLDTTDIETVETTLIEEIEESLGVQFGPLT